MMRQSSYNNYRLLIVLLWSIVICCSMVINIIHETRSNTTLLHHIAEANFKKDAAFRQWNSSVGGLYRKVTDNFKPSPYMSHIPNRDIVSKNNVHYTLMNPAWMLRLIDQDFHNLTGARAKITGLKVLNPINKADPWEKNAIEQFSKGKKLVAAKEILNGEEHFRLMKPMYMTTGCVKCHGILGYKKGDLRGGVVVSIPTEPFITELKKVNRLTYLTHFIFWLIGTVLWFLLLKALESQDLKRIAINAELLHAKEEAENLGKTKSDFLSFMSHEIR